MRPSNWFAVALVSTTAAWSHANATLITSADQASGPVDIIDFSDRTEQEITLGPVQVGNSVGRDVVFTATSAVGAAGFNADVYGLGFNGVWDETRTFAWSQPRGEYVTPSTLRFTFNDGPVAAMGAFMNYCVESWPTGCDVAVLRALDSSLNVLEEYDLMSLAPITTPNAINAGAFRGIARESADIFAFEFVGAGVFDDLTFSTRSTSIPEPATNALLGLGVTMMLLSRRRTRRNRSL